MRLVNAAPCPCASAKLLRTLGTIAIVVGIVSSTGLSRSSAATETTPPSTHSTADHLSTDAVALAYEPNSNGRSAASYASLDHGPHRTVAVTEPNWSSLLAASNQRVAVPIASTVSTPAVSHPPTPSSLNILAIGLAFLAITRKLKLLGR